MKKPKVIRTNKFFKLLADGNYTVSADSDGGGNQPYIVFLLKVNQQSPLSSEQKKGFRFFKIETDSEIKLIAIGGDGEITKIIKPRKKTRRRNENS